MCGIAGIIRLNGQNLPPEAESAVKSMTDAMIWRGPDGSGLWRDGACCLGHRRLSIIDIAGGAQPMANATNTLRIVFNGEIYNFQELKKQLEEKGIVFQTSSDTEVLLNAYAVFGESCIERLDGMFAFAIWNMAKRRLFCARDHFGKKPFYYTIQNGFLAFASELKALTTLARSPLFPGFAFSLSPSALTRYLAYEYTPTPQTMYSEVSQLEPAHFLLLEKGEPVIRRFWDLPWPADKLPGPEPELCEQLYALMKNATKLRMISDVPLGVFLSGGIDSSIVAGLMAELSPVPIQSFSIGFTEASYDESRYAKIAANAFGAIEHERILSAEECGEKLPAIAGAMDTPMADASCAPTWLLSQLARENVTVALGGDGADELWAGYEHYIGYKIALWYNHLPAFLRKKVIAPLTSLLPGSAGYINPRLAVKTFLAGAAAPDWLRVQTMLTALPPSMQKEVLSLDWLKDNGEKLLDQDILFAPTKRQFEHWQPREVSTSLGRTFHVYARQFLLDDILVKIDRCSMLNSLEVRAPFLDRHVVEFVARLPISCKLRGFKRKYLLKKAFKNLLPHEILVRNKRGFQIPVAAWLRGKLKPLLMDLLGKKRLQTQGIFNPEGVEKIMNAHFSKKADMRKPLWTLLVLQLWLEANRPAF